VNGRRCEPRVDGARIRPNRSGSAVPRQVLYRQMVSTPATMSATRHGSLRCALTPQAPPGRTCSAKGRPASRDSGHQTMRASMPGYATVASDRCSFKTCAGSFDNYHRSWSRSTLRNSPAARYPILTGWIEAEILLALRQVARHSELGLMKATVYLATNRPFWGRYPAEFRCRFAPV
jgi:hypothetical protein